MAKITALLMTVALCVSGCGTMNAKENKDKGKKADKKETETVETSELGKGLFEEAGEISVGVETEPFLDAMVADEEATEELTKELKEAQEKAAEEKKEKAASETEKKSAAETEKKSASETETKTASETETKAASETETKTASETETKAASETELKTPVETEAHTEAQTETETETETESETEDMGPVGMLVSEFIGNREALGEHWSVSYEDLETGAVYGYHDEDVMQSASVVKLFIMGAAYRYMCYPKEGEQVIPFHEEYDGQLRDTIVSMITVSDNNCANLLIERLGEGDFHLGAERIKAFCEEYGYVGTSIGRRFLESNPSGDNYTTSADSRKFLSDLYHGTLVNEEASRKMLDIVKGQTIKHKIPAGLPAGFTSGNKTGDMPEGYGLGCIENDSAIVFPPEGEGEGYILTVMSNDLAGRNSEAISVINQMSSKVAQWYLDNRSQAQSETAVESETTAP